MKSIILGTIAVVALANLSFGQGEVVIANSSSAGTKIFLNNNVGAQSTGQTGVTLPGTGTASYMFELFYNTTVNSGAGTPNVSVDATPWTGGGWVDSTQTANNQSLTGRLTENDGGNGYVTLPTSSASAVGVQANLEMIGWNVAVGGSTLSSFETAYTQALGDGNSIGLVYGYSAVANILLGNNASPGNSNFFSVPNGGVSGFTLAPVAPVPEPATLALASLGGLGLLGLRRKK